MGVVVEVAVVEVVVVGPGVLVGVVEFVQQVVEVTRRFGYRHEGIVSRCFVVSASLADLDEPTVWHRPADRPHHPGDDR